MKMRNGLEEAIAEHLLRLLVGEMRISFERSQRRMASQSAQEGLQPETASKTELESLASQARRKRRRLLPTNRSEAIESVLQS